MIDFIKPESTLYLGCYDNHVIPTEIEALLKEYHQSINDPKLSNDIKHKQFRYGDLNKWVKPHPTNNKAVSILQNFLIQAGFFSPEMKANGIFAYATQAGVRLFQEYVRTVEGKPEIGIPDGIIGPKGWDHIERWVKQNKKAEEWSRGNYSEEYKKWLYLLENAKNFYANNPHPILDKVNAKIDQIGENKINTLKTSKWNTSPDQIHLIGIRRKEDEGRRITKGTRQNDDVFVLLINGMVFKFWGSTDPQHNANPKLGAAYLVEGQHKFTFGWHQHSNGSKAYQGLLPYNEGSKLGVLVFRDQDHDTLTEEDIRKGITTNTTINIHWTGAGDGNSGTWSEGCQVISGRSYINPKRQLINCQIEPNRSYAAVGSADLNGNKSVRSIAKTKGAYNMFADLLLLYRPKNVEYIYYTLGRDETFDHEYVRNLDGGDLLSATLKVLPENLA